ncbi:hypothetical protein NIES4071_11480 [Calothrix sp. NIES-4071]|nr:hypothetical protein NIES4071_11480 [Calothrix sp. NIES-4071]BAZ55488.1 hypothetical protein NIES4105_11440 [Calothrix sp. NIES-4105]
MLLQQETRTQFEQLKSSLTGELRVVVESLDRKLKSLTVKTQDEVADLQQQIDRVNRKFSTSFQSLDDNIEMQITQVKEEIVQTQSKFQDDITVLRDLVLEEIERRFTQLGESKVSCDDMAETLFALGMRLKGTDIVSTLHTNDEESEYLSVPLLKATRLPKM